MQMQRPPFRAGKHGSGVCHGVWHGLAWRFRCYWEVGHGMRSSNVWTKEGGFRIGCVTEERHVFCSKLQRLQLSSWIWVHESGELGFVRRVRSGLLLHDKPKFCARLKYSSRLWCAALESQGSKFHRWRLPFLFDTHEVFPDIRTYIRRWHGPVGDWMKKYSLGSLILCKAIICFFRQTLIINRVNQI
jgi:hypothetical protein